MPDHMKTSEETKEEYVSKMGPKLGPVFNALWGEVAQVNVTWNEYLELYGKKSSRIELLNKAAPYFFRTVQMVYWDNTLLHISRLTDPVKIGRKENLTIQQLPELVSDELKPKVKELVDEVIKKTEFSRDWRNRRIAHKDLRLALNEPAEPLLPASRDNVRDALLAIEVVLNAVSRPYTKSISIFNKTPVASGAEHLLYVLDDGLRMESERLKKVKSRGWEPELEGARDL